jgi:hypothetical protein
VNVADITRYARTEAFTSPTEVKQSSGSRGDGYFSTASTDDEVVGAKALARLQASARIDMRPP